MPASVFEIIFLTPLDAFCNLYKRLFWEFSLKHCLELLSISHSLQKFYSFCTQIIGCFLDFTVFIWAMKVWKVMRHWLLSLSSTTAYFILGHSPLSLANSTVFTRLICAKNINVSSHVLVTC